MTVSTAVVVAVAVVVANGWFMVVVNKRRSFVTWKGVVL